MTKTILHIDSSAANEGSKSRAASHAQVKALQPTKVIRRDLAADPLPFIDDLWIKTRLKAPEDLTAIDKEVLALSDALIEELQAADTIVIGVPLYNFGCPANLKAWIDLVARPRVTFRYTDSGPIGLLTGKKAIITIASGGVPVGSEKDLASRHLIIFLAFLGITDVTVIDAKDQQAA